MKKQARITFAVNVNVSVEMWVEKTDSGFEVARVQNVRLPSASDVTKAIFDDGAVTDDFNDACAEVLGPLDIEEGEEE